MIYCVYLHCNFVFIVKWKINYLLSLHAGPNLPSRCVDLSLDFGRRFSNLLVGVMDFNKFLFVILSLRCAASEDQQQYNLKFVNIVCG